MRYNIIINSYARLTVTPAITNSLTDLIQSGIIVDL